MRHVAGGPQTRSVRSIAASLQREGRCGFVWGDSDTADPEDQHVCRINVGGRHQHECGCGATTFTGEVPKRQINGGFNLRLEGLAKHEALHISGAVRRYHTHPYVIGHQTVAEHTFRAMALMISLWPGYTRAALHSLLTHDGAEGEIGDVPSPTKWAYPELGHALSNAEDAVLARLGLDVITTPEETRWIKICDWLEGALYALDQFTLGNRGMVVVHNSFIDGLLSLEQPLPASVVEAHGRALVRATRGTDAGDLRRLPPPDDGDEF